MNLTCLCLLASLFLLSHALPLPPKHLGTWDPDEGQQEAHKEWLEMHKQHITSKDWTKVNPKDYIAHDKFNIADGYDIDLVIIEEMQMVGDPVLTVEGKTNRKAKKRDKTAATGKGSEA